MSVMRPITFWIAMLAAVLAVVVLLREVLLPFDAGMVLAYLLDPVATRLERLGMNRLIATLIIIGLFVVGVVVLIVLTAPIIVGELAYFVEKFPLYVRQSVGELTTLATGWLGTFLRSVWSGGQALIAVFSLAVVTPIVACYLIYDWSKMIAVVDHWVPPARRDTVRALAREVDDTIGGFVRGQGALCLVLSLFYAAALSLIGLNHGVLIGVAAGTISFVPYLGSLTGLAVSTCVAIAQFWPNWTLIVLVPAIFLVGQSLADYVLSPYFVGRRVRLNPVWLMFALFAFGYLFGFVGLLIAVPLAAAIGVLLRFALAHYYESPLYDTAPTAPASETASPTLAGKQSD